MSGVAPRECSHRTGRHGVAGEEDKEAVMAVFGGLGQLGQEHREVDIAVFGRTLSHLSAECLE